MAAVVLGVLFWRVPESRDESATGRLDWWGTLLVTVGLGALVYGLIQAGAIGLGNPVVLCMLAAGIVALIAFVMVEARSQAPLVPLSVFRSPTFSGANLLTLLLYGALSGLTFFLPFDTSLDSHLSALHLSPSVQHFIDAQRIKLAGIVIPSNMSAETQLALKRAVAESFVSSFRLVSLICAVLALASALSAWLLVEGKKIALPIT